MWSSFSHEYGLYNKADEKDDWNFNCMTETQTGSYSSLLLKEIHQWQIIKNSSINNNNNKNSSSEYKDVKTDYGTHKIRFEEVKSLVIQCAGKGHTAFVGALNKFKVRIIILKIKKKAEQKLWNLKKKLVVGILQ